MNLQAFKRDPFGFALSLIAASAVFGFFLLMTKDIFVSGLKVVSLNFLVADPMDAGRGGGIWPILKSTMMIMFICFLIVIPLGTISAFILHHFAGAQKKRVAAIGLCLDILAGMPSIVFGLFGLFFFGELLGLGFSILCGGLTLSIMILPYYTRSVEDGLRLVPDDYKKAGVALALPNAKIFWHIILPSAIPSLVLGFILGMSRALAETAALLFTSGYVSRSPESFLDSGRALSVHIYDLALNVPGGDQYAFGTVLVLMALLLVIFQSTKVLGRFWQRQLLRERFF